MKSGLLSNRAARGFSLIQFMVTVTIVGILSAIAVPSYRFVTTTNRIAGEINNLLGDLQYARFQAIKQGQTVTICSSSNGTSCLTGTGTTWNTGWIVFNDTNGSGTVDAGDAVLRIQQPFNGTDTLVGGVSNIKFNREGFPIALTATATMTLHATPADTHSTRCIQIGINGQIISEKAGTNACT